MTQSLRHCQASGYAPSRSDLSKLRILTIHLHLPQMSEGIDTGCNSLDQYDDLKNQAWRVFSFETGSWKSVR